MTFTAPAFLFVFLPLCVLGFAIFGRFGRRSAIGFLGFMSLVFYAEWSTKFLLLLVGSILFNYTMSRLIARAEGNDRAQTAWLTFGIISNLLCLGYFKYFFPLLHFFTAVGLSHRDWGSVILPLGISFFTFTQIAYLVDLSQGAAERESLISYVLFVTFFPHLVAGPILHHKEIMPQLREERRYGIDRADVGVGLAWFSLGLFKKLIVADNIVNLADKPFADPRHLGLWGTWLGVLAYAMQLYFDFSGYSDMAVGLARMFSIRFPFNFNSPYKAASIIDFWQRWHMTLTRYITLYLYNPMAMSMSRRRIRQGKKASKKAQRTLGGFTQIIAFPMITTMFLAGIWHGAGLQFILFGLAHGIYLTINHIWRIFVPEDSRWQRLLPTPVGVLLTFACVLVGQVFFRAPSVDNALSVFSGLAGRHGLGPGWQISQFLIIAALLTIVWVMPNTQEILGQTNPDDEPTWSLIRPRAWQPADIWWIAAFFGAAWAIALAMLPLGYRPFIYFQF